MNFLGYSFFGEEFLSVRVFFLEKCRYLSVFVMEKGVCMDFRKVISGRRAKILEFSDFVGVVGLVLFLDRVFLFSVW